MRSTALGLGLLLLGCPNMPNQQPPPTGCGPSSCTGCCDRDGVCQVGLATGACGKEGAQCTPCGMGLSCNAGVCSSSGGTGGGSSTGTGGGSATGGSTGTLGQELVSGTRLRAIYHHGPDGSRSALQLNVFWDTMLNAYCSPWYHTQLCMPVRYVRESERGTVYSNATCTQQELRGQMEGDFAGHMVDAGLPAGEAFFMLNDGGVFSAAPSQAWSMSGGPCMPASGSWWAPVMQLSSGVFAPMPVRRE